ELGVARVLIGVERPVESGEETYVEDLQEDEESEHRPGDPGQDAPSFDRHDGGRGNEDETLKREPQECRRLEGVRLVRSDECGPDEQKREDRERRASTRS